jgi:hypothetical protein
MSVGPGDQERQIEIKGLAEIAYSDLIPELLLVGVLINVIGNHCS